MRALMLSTLLLIALPAFAAPPLTFEEVDTDGDGLISADEAASVEGLEFSAADADNDGTLSVDEYDIAVENLSPTDAASSTDAAQPAAPAASPGAAPSEPVPPTTGADAAQSAPPPKP